METTDKMLSVIENPMRRKILAAVVREPCYPLQLSKELGVSHQAVVKNLRVLEDAGLLESRRTSSEKGPDRTLYSLKSGFTLTVDMHGRIFRVRIRTDKNTGDENEKLKTNDENRIESIDDVRARLSEIDGMLAEADRRRTALLQARSRAVEDMLSGFDMTGLDYAHRQLLYDMLDMPDWGVSDLSESLGFNESAVSRMMGELIDWFEECTEEKEK